MEAGAWVAMGTNTSSSWHLLHIAMSILGWYGLLGCCDACTIGVE